LESLKTQDHVSAVFLTVYATVHHRSDHFCNSIEPFLHAYRIGMQTGDILNAMINAQQSCLISFLCGKELNLMETDVRTYIQKMSEYKQEETMHRLLPLWQIILNLIGPSKNPCELTGKAMDQTELLDYASKHEHFSLMSSIMMKITWLNYLFGNYELAGKWAEEMREIPYNEDNTTVSQCVHVFYEGLIYCALARKTKEKRWKRKAAASLTNIKKWASHAPCNYDNKLNLIEAEFASLMGEKERSAEKYKSSISAAGTHKFLPEQALAYERAAIFYLEEGDNSSASWYYGQAHNAYLEWGAKAKANHIREHLPF